jgi:hypothetical protein
MRHLSMFEESGIGPLHRIVFDTFREKYVVDHYDTFPVSNPFGEWDMEVGLVHDSRQLIFFLGHTTGSTSTSPTARTGSFRKTSSPCGK